MAGPREGPAGALRGESTGRDIEPRKTHASGHRRSDFMRSCLRPGEQQLEGDGRDCEEIHGSNSGGWLRTKASQRRTSSGFLGACFIQREMFCSDTAKPSPSGSPLAARGACKIFRPCATLDRKARLTGHSDSGREARVWFTNAADNKRSAPGFDLFTGENQKKTRLTSCSRSHHCWPGA